ncbi:MAG: hypothetical protein JWN30_73, partial [Bacilli bacterium]|nr:hypothetical protein [Bacilli bacterium]
ARRIILSLWNCTRAQFTSFNSFKATNSFMYKGVREMIWNLDSLSRAPRVFPADLPEQKGVQAIFFEGMPYQGKQTRLFAYYAIPEHHSGEKVPGVVLVHGGGGTAFEQWVRIWAERGYAAIAMDLEGHYPGEKVDKIWPAHSWSGPARQDIFADYRLPVEEQWMYHAAANVVLANSLLRSFDAVDEKRIGMTGISWGGIICSLVAGLDQRFRFAIPVYGCGYLFEAQNQYGRAFANMGADADRVISMWDPSSYLPDAAMPMLWVNSTGDQHFSPEIFTKSYRSVKSRSVLSIQPGMKHSHAHGWAPQEIYAFADSIVQQQLPLPSITRNEKNIIQAKFTVDTQTSLTNAELCYTEDRSDWFKANWAVIPAQIDVSNTILAEIPDNCQAYFLNVTDSRGLVVSSDLVIL